MEGATNEGFDITKVLILINIVLKLARKHGQKLLTLTIGDFTQPQVEEKIYDVVVLSDILKSCR